MATSSVPAVLDALRTALIARAGLSGVKVFTGPVDPQTAGLESIEFYDVDDETQEAVTLGNTRRDEDYTVHGVVWVTKAGADEAVIKASRDRAFAIFAEVENELRSNYTLGGVVLWCLPSASNLRQRITDQGRTAFLKFNLRTKARI